MRKFLAFMLVVLLTVAVGCTEKRQPLPIEGKAAPDFTLKDLDGQSVKLSSLRGKVVLLNFWATWCPPCREEIPSMVKLNGAMAGKPFQMLAVSIDEGGKDAVETFFKQSGSRLPVLLDAGQIASKLYGITGVPETFVIDQNGVILKKVIGPMDWHSPEVITFLEQLMKPK